MKKRTTKYGIGFGALTALTAVAAPASAGQSTQVPVTVSLGSPAAAGRTLTLQDLTSGQPLANLDLSNLTTGFIAKVTDATYAPTGFTVKATMSNLYGYANGAWNCSAEIPSSAVSLQSPSSLLGVTGLSASVTPVFQVSGDLSTVLAPLLGGRSGLLNVSVVGNSVSLNQQQISTSGATMIGGTLLTTLAGVLPIQLSVPVGGAFYNPATDPTGAVTAGGQPCTPSAGTSPTNVAVMQGAANTSGLLTDVQRVVGALGNGTSAPVSTLIASVPPWLGATAVLDQVASTLGINGTLLSGNSALQTSIFNALSATVTALQPAVVSVSGQYAATPTMTLNPTNIPAGSYKGTLTVTLADN